MDLITSVSVVGLFLLAAAAAWPAMYVVWSRAVADSNELGLWRLLRQRGVARKDAARAEPDLSRAVYRCIACDQSSRCDALLDAGRAAEIVVFCPNRDFVAGCAARHQAP